MTPPRRIAIVGSGIAGLTAARLLHRRHEVTLFEAADRLGGHTATIDVQGPDGVHAVDTGFIVFNPTSYPNFVRLLDEIGVSSRKTSMTFSVRNERSGLEYGGGGLQRIFAQRRNAVRPRFLRMLLEIRRFYREAGELLEGDDDLTLQEYVDNRGYSRDFVEDHLVPFGAAIWSASAQDMRRFPARFFVQFFANHGFLRLRKPEWRVIEGGSRQYLTPLTAPFADRIRLSTPVQQIRRRPAADGTTAGVDVALASGGVESFDDVVLATHTDQALALLADPSRDECEVLSAMGYQENHVVLHSDISRLPQARRAWSSWNYRIPADETDRVTVTYNMNILQHLEAAETYCVTLNESAGIDPARVHGEFVYHHPRYTLDYVAAQRRWDEVSGVRNTHFCGAGWGYGFHEDGVVSGLRVARHFGEEL
jgi:predicted NAD/FAD-binding protein